MHAPQFQYSLRGLLLFTMAIGGSLSLIASDGALQPFGIISAGYTLIFACLAQSH